MSTRPDAITITLSAVARCDAFGLGIDVDGKSAARTIAADGPGVFRRLARTGDGLIAAGGLVGLLQRGPMLLPVVMPGDGWLLAAALDGTRTEHGTPLLRILLAQEGVLP